MTFVEPTHEFAIELLEKLGGRERFVSSYSNRTFSPERQASSSLNEVADVLDKASAELRSSGASDEDISAWREQLSRKWLAMEAAGARTVNWMITGPARFPVARNEKAMAIEHKRTGEYLDFINSVGSWMSRRKNSAARAAKSEAAKGQTFEEIETNGLILRKNTALDRVQLIFPEKPDEEFRKDLKRSGFRWSPREGAWQRQLTRNGLYAANGIQAAWCAA